MAKGFLSLVVIRDWVSRAVLARRLSNTLFAEGGRRKRPNGAGRDALEGGPRRWADHEASSRARLAVVHGCPLTRRSTSMPTVAEATAGIGAWLSLCNEEWQQQGGMLEADPEEVGSMS